MNPRKFHNVFKILRLKQIRVTSKAVLSIERLSPISFGSSRWTRMGLFRNAMDWIFGYRRVYSKLSDAEGAAAPYLALTTNPTAYVDLHLDLSAAARPSDYAVLFHLNKIVNKNTETKVFDLGGCAGNLYDSYSAYLDHPERLTWVVNDLPEILAEAERLRGDTKPPRLRFTNSMEEIADCDVLLVSGALHYFSTPLREMLERRSARPSHILINRTPLTDAAECATVQDANGFLMACRLWNRLKLIEDLRSIGYEKRDEWKAPELSLRIPLHPESSVSEYSGLYFRSEGIVEESGATNPNRVADGIRTRDIQIHKLQISSAENL